MPNDATVARRIGQLLKHQRVDVLGLTLPEVEKMVGSRYNPGVRFQQVHKLENGDVERPSLRDIVMLCEAYGISILDVIKSSGLAYPNVTEPRDTDARRAFKTLANALLTTADDSQLESILPMMQAVASHFRSASKISVGA